MAGPQAFVAAREIDGELYVSLKDYTEASGRARRKADIVIGGDSVRQLRMAYLLMANEDGLVEPGYSVCGLLPAGGVHCQNMAEVVKNLLKEVLKQIEEQK